MTPSDHAIPSAGLRLVHRSAIVLRPVRFAFSLFALSLWLTGCGRDENAELHHQMTGTWVLYDFGTITFEANGKCVSRFGGKSQQWTYEGN